MKKFLILASALCSFIVSAQNVTEEAIILNQELKFLEDSVNDVQAISINASSSEQRRQEALNEPSLEKTFFGEEVQGDVVSTRSAVPRRRGL